MTSPSQPTRVTCALLALVMTVAVQGLWLGDLNRSGAAAVSQITA